LCFTDDGLHLVSFGTDNTLRTWNVARGRNTDTNFGFVQNATQKCVKLCVSSSATSPPLVYVPSGSNIHVYDASRGRQRAVLRGHYTQVNGCIHHPDDHSLYSCGNDRNILVWTPLTSTVEAYEDYIDDLAKVKAPRTAVITSRTLATADAWSSDED
jgi:DNA excision repair protein ERCC-8